MKILLILGSIVGPIIMILLQRKSYKFRTVYNLLAILSALIFGNISSIAVYNIIKNETVFMTNIHGLFLNPFFLITAAYLGLYYLYLLILRTFDHMDSSNPSR